MVALGVDPAHEVLFDAPLPRLRAAVRVVAGEDVDALSDAALGEDLLALRQEIDRLELEFNRRLRRFDAQRGWSASGAVSTVAWLRTTCRLGTTAAVQHVDVARQLPDLPLTQRSADDGDIGFHHVAVIARCATQLGADAVRPVESVLVDVARDYDPAKLHIATRHLRHCADPDGVLADTEADNARRFLCLSQTYDGVFALDGMLDPEGGALLRTALESLDSRAPGDDRTAAQRRADALIELARRTLQRGDLPAVAGERPHLTLTTSDATLRREPGSPAGDMRWAGPVVADTVRRIACDASVTRASLDARGEPLHVGRATRVIPSALRRALVVRDGGCRFPGCDRPPEWTDAHHVKHWADGGETDLENLVLLCRRHHRVVHEGRWRVVSGDDGRLVAEPP